MTVESGGEPFSSLLQRRVDRRSLLLHTAAFATSLALPAPWDTALAAGRERSAGFVPIRGSRNDAVVVPGGYESRVLIGWGDPLFADAPRLDTRSLASGALLDAEAARRQSRQFGYNCDALAYFALDRAGRRGLLCVNHEYTNAELMFPRRQALGRESGRRLAEWSQRHPGGVHFELMAHGVSVVEIVLEANRWRTVAGSRYARRITGETPVAISGPARGHALLRTQEDPDGRRVRGTLANCAGGKTPWGTYLTAEENVDDYFGGFDSFARASGADPRIVAAHGRFPLREYGYRGWEHTERRFDLRAAPTEPLRFGWIVEIDPRRPDLPPRKLTALGRFSHEGATTTLARDRRVAVYLGDDDPFEYVYKFVSSGRFDPERGTANAELLDRGVLHVARFEADGSGRWLPLVHDPRGPLNARNGFADAGEVLIRARAAADLLGATPMDRPEDIEVHPQTGRVYVALTKNERRRQDSEPLQVGGREVAARVDAANPRPENAYGHVLEIEEAAGDAAATEFRWNVFLLAGDPDGLRARLLASAAELVPGRLGARDVYYAGAAAGPDLAPIGCPDNLGFDRAGRLWIVTDGVQPRGTHNGAFVVATEGPDRGRLRQFMSAPLGAEVCGCEFGPDDATLFLSVQHPGEGGSLERPVSDWPDGGGRPPRPGVIAIRRADGGPVGG